MSIVFQYVFLRQVLHLTHTAAKTPSAIAVQYEQIQIFRFLLKFPKIKGYITRRQWQTCCVLFNMGLVEMQNVSGWQVAVSKDGAIYAANLKLQIIKSIFTFLLAVFSAVFGFWLGALQQSC